MDKKMIRVYDTITKKYVDVEVNEDFLKEYNRSQWRIDDNDKSFYKHEIQFSLLKLGLSDDPNTFIEFRTPGDMVEQNAIELSYIRKLRDCLNNLPREDRDLIILLFFCGKTERECASIYGISQKNINKKKNRILCTLYKLLQKE